MAGARSKQALVIFFVIAFGVPWTGWLVLYAFGGNAPYARALFFTGLACSLAGIVATAWDKGWQGIRDLFARALRLRAPLRWWAFALLVPFACAAAIPIGLMALSDAPIAVSPEGLAGLGTQVGLMGLLFLFIPGPLGEEFGWRGFLLPRLAARFGPLPAIIFVALVWGPWHWPLYLARIEQSPLWFGQFLIGATLMSFLIGAVFLRTGSLFLAMLMHWSINASQEIVFQVFSGIPNPQQNPLPGWLLIAALSAFAVASVPAILRSGGDIERQRT